MKNVKFGLAGSLALAVAFVAAPSIAAEARSSGNAAVRDGPGNRYAIIDHLEDGEYYEVEECTRRSIWCLVSDDDGYELGWVRGSYLVGSRAKREATPFEFLVDPFPFKTFPF